MMTDAATPETATASQDPTLAGAARAIEQLEERRRRSEEGEEGNAGTATGKDNVGDDAASAAESEHAAGEGEDSPSPDEPRYRVKVDGEEAEVPLRELVQGYQRGADYTRKTMRLADERREVEQLRAQVDDELAAAT